jgi:DNA-binding winged helix-turn-helix (wHTH) protein/TolB-like protein
MPGHVWRFSRCEFDDLRHELRVGGVPVHVEAKPLELLRHLLLHAGEVVTKDELLESVWPGVTVVDGSLATAVSKLRKALGADEGVIVTLPRVGYRLGVPVERQPSAGPNLVEWGDSRGGRATIPPATPSTELIERPTDLDAQHDALAEPVASVAGRGKAHARRPWILAATMTTGLAIVTGLFIWGRTPASSPVPARLKTVGVLPLRNAGADVRRDFLRIALADEVATILSHVRGVAVRPSSPISATARESADHASVGRAMGVDTVVTGHFLDTGDRLTITIEAIEAATGRLQWRDTLDAPLGSMMALQVQLALRIRGGLARAIGGSSTGAADEPRNEEAYRLFLQSAGLSSDSGPNREAVGLLERAVALDAAYAPAWQALSKRYYIEARYGSGDTTLLQRSQTTAERAVALDPSFTAPAAGLIVSRVEQGDLVTAFTRGVDLVHRRPDSVDAQFALSYVYRYAGLLGNAARHCEAGFLLDPRNSTSGLRSCAVVFLLRDDYARAMNYLHLDQGSAFEQALSLHSLVRQGREAEARQLTVTALPDWGSWKLLLACVQQRPAPEIASMAGELTPAADAETNYFAASHLAYCGRPDAAAAMLTRAIDASYCSFPALDSDPLFAPLRRTAAFSAIRQSARVCQQAFLARTKAVPIS